jgi:hypothetical protein
MIACWSAADRDRYRAMRCASRSAAILYGCVLHATLPLAIW